MPRLDVRAFGATDCGRVRSENEDSFLVDNDLGLYAVADGLGGLPEGALASRLTVETLAEIIKKEPEAAWPSVMERVNEAVFNAGQAVDSQLGIGSTLTAARIQGDVLKIAHVGDSGIYYFAKAGAKQLTIEHTMERQILEETKEETATPYIPSYFKHALTECVGQKPEMEVFFCEQPMKAGDRFLLYTDGISKSLAIGEIEDMVREAEGPESLVKALIDAANERGGEDNMGVVALFIEKA